METSATLSATPQFNTAFKYGIGYGLRLVLVSMSVSLHVTCTSAVHGNCLCALCTVWHSYWSALVHEVNFELYF